MKIISLSILFSLLFFDLSYSQSKEMKKAVENGKIQNYLYEANFKRTHDKSEINKWCTNNGFVLLSVKEGQIDRFGKLMNGIVSARFATYSDYAYLMEQEKRNQHSRDEAKSKNRGNDVIAAFAAVIGIGAILVGGYIINKESGSRNGNYDSSISINESVKIAINDKKVESQKCYLRIKEAFKAYVGCNGFQTTVYEIDCIEGSSKYYYYIPSDQSYGICSREKGYYLGTGSISDFGQDYLGKNYENAMKQICGCEM